MSEVPDDVKAMRERLRERPLGDGESSVPPDRLLALLDGELSPEQAQDLAERVVDDADLALELRVAAAIRDEREAMLRSEAEPESEPVTSRWGYVSTAVAVLAAALIALWFTRRPTLEDPGTDQIRAGSAEDSIRSTLGDEPLPRDAFELRWEGGPPDTTYDVFVTTPGLDPLHRAFDLEEARVRVPAGALDGLPPGSRVLWRVTATTKDGRSTSSAGFEASVR